VPESKSVDLTTCTLPGLIIGIMSCKIGTSDAMAEIDERKRQGKAGYVKGINKEVNEERSVLARLRG
jgi:hypothetical protein